MHVLIADPKHEKAVARQVFDRHLEVRVVNVEVARGADGGVPRRGVAARREAAVRDGHPLLVVLEHSIPLVHEPLHDGVGQLGGTHNGRLVALEAEDQARVERRALEALVEADGVPVAVPHDAAGVKVHHHGHQVALVQLLEPALDQLAAHVDLADRAVAVAVVIVGRNRVGVVVEVLLAHADHHEAVLLELVEPDLEAVRAHEHLGARAQRRVHALGVVQRRRVAVAEVDALEPALRVPLDPALLVRELLHRRDLAALARHKLEEVAVARVRPARHVGRVVVEVGVALVILVLPPVRWQLREERELGDPEEVLLVGADAHVGAHLLELEADLAARKVHGLRHPAAAPRRAAWDPWQWPRPRTLRRPPPA